MAPRSVVIHGHFYQPPREDPWTGRVPRQPSAAPAHDWNERVHDECYRAVVAARVLDGEGRIAQVVNTLEWISWDAGPTLLEWLAEEAPATYTRLLEADARSRARTGHGNAIAAPYHHVILPLASRRDKVTEIRWGVRDFRRRFGREPEGMWLPEAAVDSETLEALALEGIRFTVLGPSQVRRAPAGGLPGRVSLPGGKEIAVFVYDGPMSHDVAFGALLRDSELWLERVVEASAGRELLSVATDGETFGHHHRWGEMALAGLLAAGEARSDLRFEGFGAFLARHPPMEEIEILEPSSWSCAHGVDRWRRDCGCKIDPSQATSQEWRSGLRDALEWLASELHARFEGEGGQLLADPWTARDEYAALMGSLRSARERAVTGSLVAGAPEGSAARATELLDMERDALRMMTSCAWFFDDVARLEPLQNLMYAGHALDLFGQGADGLEGQLLERLEEIVSNDPQEGTAADLWRSRVRGVERSEPSPGEASATEATAPAEREVERLVWRAVANPAAESVTVLDALLDAAPEVDLFDVQTVVAEKVRQRDAVGPDLIRLAQRLGVSPQPTEPALPVGGPVRFVFGIHLHQPVGNFDRVFSSHVEEVYLPFLERCRERGFLPMALHVSGPLLEWLESKGHPFLEVVAEMVGEGVLEPLLSGFYEPVLPALSREDRLEQIAWMREWLSRRFGAEGRGLWLTERVWEPGLARDLVEAGVEYVLTDDRHFLVAGIERHELDRPWRTESEGRGLTVLPIDQRLRYLIPFRSPAEVGDYFRTLAGKGRQLAVLADDGEKFGGWPGTAAWVWDGGWLETFLDEMERLSDEGIVRLTLPSKAVADVPSAGLAYLPTASYYEMETWSLPPTGAAALERARAALEGEEGAEQVLRGGHWRGFLAKYDEANRMHMKAEVLSELCRSAGDPAPARRSIGRAQCNDAYWHGVFGGLYLRHLRDAIWSNLGEAERLLRVDERLSAEWLDLDGDGREELWVHSSRFSAVVRTRGGCLVELTDFDAGVNLANVLTRRRESYHRTAFPTGDGATPDEGAMPSIHDLEEALHLETLPPVDLDVRALLVDRVLPEMLELATYAAAEYAPLHSWARERFEADLDIGESGVALSLVCGGLHGLEKTLEFSELGTVTVTYRWDPTAFPSRAYFAPELSLAAAVDLTCSPAPEEIWRHPIVTVSKRESGLEETEQGESVTPRWRCGIGEARLVLSAALSSPRSSEDR